MLTIRQYNKIVHDWVVLLTGLSGSNVRPQKDRFGFELTDPTGKPLAFDSLIAMFYFGFDGEAQTRAFNAVDTIGTLNNASLTLTFLGENCEQYANQVKATAYGVTSRTYLDSMGFALQGEINEIQNDKEYAEKWFRRKTLRISFNVALDFVPPNTPLEYDIDKVPTTVQGLDFTAKTPTEQTKTVVPSGEQQVVVADTGKVLEKVIVEAIALQEKSVEPTNVEQVVTPDSEFSGLSKVTVGATPSYEPELNTQTTLLGELETEINELPDQPSGEVELTKNGTYDVKNYATAVVSVGEEKDVNFYDYDGTLVASYTIEEANALTALPIAPDHSQDEVPLTFQEWNYTLEEINALDHIADVGANYITTDGKTYVYFYLNKATGLTPSVRMYLQYVSYSYNLYKLPENTLIDTYTSGVMSGSKDRQLQNITEYGNYRLELTFTGDGISSHEHYVDTYNSIISTKTETKIYFGDLWTACNIYSAIFEKASITKNMGGNNTIKNLKCFVIPRYTKNNKTSTFYDCEIICTNPTMATYKSRIDKVRGNTKRLVVYYLFNSISNTNIKELYLSPLLASVGGLSSNNYIEELKLPPSVTSTGNYFYAPRTDSIGYLKKAIFLGDITSFHGNTFGQFASIDNGFGDIYLELIDLSHCTSVPSLSVAELPKQNPKLQIVVPDELYDQWIVATNWATYANYIIKASEYVEG